MVSSRLYGETIAEFTGRCRARQTWRSWDHDGRTDCLEGQATIDDFIECEGSLAVRSRGCGLHVSWWRLPCVICKRRFSISMLRTNELRLVPDMPIKVAMESPCPVQPRCKHAGREHCRAVLLDRHGSTPLRRSPGRGVPIQRHRHVKERRWRPSRRKQPAPVALP